MASKGENTHEALAHSLNPLTKGIIGMCGIGGRELAKESWSMDEVQKMVVDPEEITSLVHEMNLRRQEHDEVDWLTCMAILFDRYPDDVPRTFCINERMQAFLL